MNNRLPLPAALSDIRSSSSGGGNEMLIRIMELRACFNSIWGNVKIVSNGSAVIVFCVNQVLTRPFWIPSGCCSIGVATVVKLG